MSTYQMSPLTSWEGIKVSIIFSFRNEEDVLPELVTRVRNILKLEIERNVISHYELIFVNDRSTDQSEKILKELNIDNGDIKIITMSRVFGVSPCVIAGLSYCTGDAAIYMDADLQDPPEVIPEILEAWQKGDNINVVHTIRRSRAGESYLKLKITKIGYWILRKVSNIDLITDAGDFKLLSRRVINHIIQLTEYNPFLRGLVIWVGFNQTRISYDREERFSGQTKFPIISRKVISNFFYSALISFSSGPLQLASLAGLVCIIFSTAMAVFMFYVKFYGFPPPDRTAIMLVLFSMGSMQLFALGILGLYVHSIFISSKNRPNYIVESTFGFSEEELEVLQKIQAAGDMPEQIRGSNQAGIDSLVKHTLVAP